MPKIDYTMSLNFIIINKMADSYYLNNFTYHKVDRNFADAHFGIDDNINDMFSDFVGADCWSVVSNKEGNDFVEFESLPYSDYSETPKRDSMIENPEEYLQSIDGCKVIMFGYSPFYVHFYKNNGNIEYNYYVSDKYIEEDSVAPLENRMFKDLDSLKFVDN